MSLLEAPCAKTLWRAFLFRAIFGITGAFSCVLTYDGLNKPKTVKQVWVATIVILSNSSFKGVFNCACVYAFCEVPIKGAQRFYFVGALLFCDNVQTHLGVLLLGMALLKETLWYVDRFCMDQNTSDQSWEVHIYVNASWNVVCLMLPILISPQCDILEWDKTIHINL